MTISVRHEPEATRWVADLDDEEAGVAEYELLERPPRIVFTHTLVPPRLEGRGIASALIEQALADVRAGRVAEGREIVPACSFVAAWMTRHPQV
ncbi:GNAT family N-acetyltransferase [Nocardioides acrostichi]|uniref:N-acetyltransferase n=1 Tax=Nocardioides acrostichi TaxID=2784339 RepID=A0A930V161_9ACTN|nr:GNAT family N-acetyltransferase [Nocardioides acrostichi]MBF4163811.1 N-acetyltransferase [Nocardioides acrostichi]